MKQTTTTPAQVKKRSFLLVLPLLMLPFLALAFWALGGGASTPSAAAGTTGLNLRLPDAQLKPEQQDKLSFYELAEAAEKKRREALLNDPYFRDSTLQEPSPATPPGLFAEDQMPLELRESTPFATGIHQQNSPASTEERPPEEVILQKIQQLNDEIDKPNAPPSQTATILPVKEDTHFSANVDRLEEMMSLMKQGNAEDPEMQKLNDILERIIDIQHPVRVKSPATQNDTPTTLHLATVPVQATDTGFYGLEEFSSETQESNAIQAVIHGTQALVDGAVIRIRLEQDVWIENKTIPKETLLAGLAHVNGERLQVELTSIRSGNSLFPVNMEVYDLDGLPGIYIPGSVNREVARAEGDNALQKVDIAGLDPSLRAQLLSGGMSAARSLFSKKIRQVKVQVKDGYKILLKQK